MHTYLWVLWHYLSINTQVLAHASPPSFFFLLHKLLNSRFILPSTTYCCFTLAPKLHLHGSIQFDGGSHRRILSLHTCLASPSQSSGPDAICDPQRCQSRGQTIPIQESSPSWSGSLFSCSPVHSKPHPMTPGRAELFLFLCAAFVFFFFIQMPGSSATH